MKAPSGRKLRHTHAGICISDDSGGGISPVMKDAIVIGKPLKETTGVDEQART